MNADTPINPVNLGLKIHPCEPSTDQQGHTINDGLSCPPLAEKEELASQKEILVPAATPIIMPTTLAREKFPQNLPRELSLILGQNGIAYSAMEDAGNPYVLPVGCRRLNNLIREVGSREGLTLRKADIADINHFLQAHAETTGISKNVWHRVAPVQEGIEIDLGDENHTRARITAGNVEIVKRGSESLLYQIGRAHV